jgi:hypothetical protein
MQCPRFIGLDSRQRSATVARLQVCRNCLYSHEGDECRSAKTCKECNMRHHTLLHDSTMKNVSANYSKSRPWGKKPAGAGSRSSCNHLSGGGSEALLTTVLVKVRAVDGAYVILRALLDQCSQVNLVDENAAQLLKLPRSGGVVSGVGGSKECKGRVQLNCKSIYSDYVFGTKALVVNKITNNLPNSTFERKNWAHLEDLKFADPDYNVSRRIDLLLGAGVYAKVI